MGQGGRDRRLAETIAPQRLSGIAEKVGGGADIVVDRSEQEDEQRLREVMCEWRSVRLCWHDSPHAEAAHPRLRTFHTASEGIFSEVRATLAHEIVLVTGAVSFERRSSCRVVL